MTGPRQHTSAPRDEASLGDRSIVGVYQEIDVAHGAWRAIRIDRGVHERTFQQRRSDSIGVETAADIARQGLCLASTNSQEKS